MKSLIIKCWLLCLFAIPAWAQAPVHLTVADFESAIKAEPKPLILDVRTKSEFDQGHIPGAVLMDYYQPDFKEKLNKLDKSKKIVLYCAAGVRSGRALQMFMDSGFRQVADLQGGFQAWLSTGRPKVP